MTYKEAIEALLTPGQYLRRLPGTKKRSKLRLYMGRQTVIAKIPEYYYWRLRDTIKESQDGKLTLSRRLIQKQHGSRLVKRIYRQRLAQEKANKEATL